MKPLTQIIVARLPTLVPAILFVACGLYLIFLHFQITLIEDTLGTAIPATPLIAPLTLYLGPIVIALGILFIFLDIRHILDNLRNAATKNEIRALLHK